MPHFNFKGADKKLIKIKFIFQFFSLVKKEKKGSDQIQFFIVDQKTIKIIIIINDIFVKYFKIKF